MIKHPVIYCIYLIQFHFYLRLVIFAYKLFYYQCQLHLLKWHSTVYYLNPTKLTNKLQSFDYPCFVKYLFDLLFYSDVVRHQIQFLENL